MVIYEVNLAIERSVYSQFQIWLKVHAKEILQFPGFISVHILKPENEPASAQEKLTVQYQLEDRESLDVYFTRFAEKIREEAVSRFQDKFSVERRVFDVQEYILK